MSICSFQKKPPVPAADIFTSLVLGLSLHSKLAEGSDLAGNYFGGVKKLPFP